VNITRSGKTLVPKPTSVYELEIVEPQPVVLTLAATPSSEFVEGGAVVATQVGAHAHFLLLSLISLLFVVVVVVGLMLRWCVCVLLFVSCSPDGSLS
jgi:hypothetical protein